MSSLIYWLKLIQQLTQIQAVISDRTKKISNWHFCFELKHCKLAGLFATAHVCGAIESETCCQLFGNSLALSKAVIAMGNLCRLVHGAIQTNKQS